MPVGAGSSSLELSSELATVVESVIFAKRVAAAEQAVELITRLLLWQSFLTISIK